MLEIASTLTVRMGPYRAMDRMDPVVESWKDILEDSHPLVVQGAADQCSVAGSSGVVDAVVDAVDDADAVADADVAEVSSELDKGQDRTRLDLGHRPCRLGHRTPVLYSRNQPRTNIVP